ncbi:MAG: hypothetical protein ACK42C_00080 [Aquificaceae bacterium]
MVVRKIEVLEVDKNFEMRLRLYTKEGIFSMWGYIDSKGKVYNTEGKMVTRISPEYAKALRDIARKRLQRTYAESKAELAEVGDVLCGEN